jgi:hypothetical protein
MTPNAEPPQAANACPVCNGHGTVSRPPHVAGDVPWWVGSSIESYPCRACSGTGLVWPDADRWTEWRAFRAEVKAARAAPSQPTETVAPYRIVWCYRHHLGQGVWRDQPPVDYAAPDIVWAELRLIDSPEVALTKRIDGALSALAQQPTEAPEKGATVRVTVNGIEYVRHLFAAAGWGWLLLDGERYHNVEAWLNPFLDALAASQAESETWKAEGVRLTDMVVALRFDLAAREEECAILRRQSLAFER